MNYFNQGYMNTYPYNYVQTPQPQQFISQPMAPQGQLPQLNGKIVDSVDMVKVAEVPASCGYGVFPKADLSEIFIKSWNGNGTTSITTFKPTEPSPQETTEISQLIERFNILETKIDNLLTAPTAIHKKEAKANEY